MNKIRATLMAVKDPKAYSDKFKKQEIYFDNSSFNQNTGEKYPNYVLIENINDKLDLSPFQVGDVVDVEFYLNGRFYDRKEGKGRGFGQSLSGHKIEAAKNTAGDPIKIPLDEMEIPELPE